MAYLAGLKDPIMQGAFEVFLELGWGHILDASALDHLLFLLVLCVGYSLESWRTMGLLVTAFTIGHAITLALVTTGTVAPNEKLVETLIPLTIVWAAIGRMRSPAMGPKGSTFLYVLIVIFGIIHGMGFSTTLRAMLPPGESVVVPLLGFNVGVELGQLLIVSVLLVLNEIVLRIGANRLFLARGICAVAAIWGIVMFVSRLVA